MDYWRKRQEAMYKVGEMQVNQYFKRLEKAFNQSKRELQKTIEAFYFRYAEENGLSFVALRSGSMRRSWESLMILLRLLWITLGNTTNRSIICP